MGPSSVTTYQVDTHAADALPGSLLADVPW